MAEQKEKIFRKESLERISSPEQLTDYLRVTNPGIWIILASIITHTSHINPHRNCLKGVETSM